MNTTTKQMSGSCIAYMAKAALAVARAVGELAAPRRVRPHRSEPYTAAQRAALHEVAALTSKFVALHQYRAAADINSALILQAKKWDLHCRIEETKFTNGIFSC